MSKFKKYIYELSYPGNIGWHELTMFYQKASDKQIKEMEKIIKNEDWNSFKKMISKVLKVDLQ